MDSRLYHEDQYVESSSSRGMAITKGMAAKLNEDASGRKRSKTVDNDDGDSGSWSYLIHDILISIISRLGVIDFVSFSCVCKSWRTVALSNRKMFMLSRQPMPLRVSTEVAKKKECYLEDLEGRKFKTILPGSSDSICLGLVSGYVILLGSKTRDFRLVNPITRHELHFPRFDFHKDPDPELFRCILLFSSTLSTWVFVFSIRFSMEVSFSFSSERANWTHLYSDFHIQDLHFFQGKIYTLNNDISLCEVRLGPTPTLTLQKMKNSNFMAREVLCPEFATWGEKLYAVGYHFSECTYAIVEIDFDQMGWVNSTIALKEHVCFLKVLKSGFTKLQFWTDVCEQYTKFVYDKRIRHNQDMWFFNVTDRHKTKRVCVTPHLWYFTHKCLDVNLLHE